MSSTSMNLDDFLGHKPNAGMKSGFLRGWKSNNPPLVDTWLNVRAPIISIWQHNWPRIVEREIDGQKVREVWGGTFNSWESEDVLKNQYRRDRSTDERNIHPVVCPMSLMIEEVRRLIREGELDWTAKLFKFVGSDPAKVRILHAGGLYNAFGAKDITDNQKREIKKAKISLKDSWRENMMAKCNYLFRVVDNDNTSEGIQIAIETTLLGDKVKEVIRDAITAQGQEDGNPMRNPYCIRWEYKPNEAEFNKRYKAIKMDRIPLTTQVEDLINADPPEVANLTKPGNIEELRTSMESHYIGPKGLLDWDFIFSKAEALKAEQDDEPFYKDADAQEEELLDKPAKKKKTNGKARKAKAPEPEEIDDIDDDLVECDECDGLMKEDEMICPHCGFDYSEEEESEPPPPPPKRTRTKKKSKSKKQSSKKRPNQLPF